LGFENKRLLFNIRIASLIYADLQYVVSADVDTLEEEEQVHTIGLT